MDRGRSDSPQLFRLWIVTYADWRPTRWQESPPRAIALEAIDNALYSASEAALFLQGFNGSMLENPQQVWAVAVGVQVRYEGDAQRGMPVQGHVFAEEPATANSTLPSDASALGTVAAGPPSGM